MSYVQTLASKLTLTPDLSPVDRDRNYKGRIRQIFSTISSHALQTLLINLLGVLFWAPLVIVFMYVLPQIIENGILAGYSFTGSLGIGYGATPIETINEAITKLYDARVLYSLALITPCVMFASIGMSGVYNCMRNLLWGVECKTFKHFFLGIKRHWYKFLIVYTCLGILATGFVVSLLKIQLAYAIGQAPNAGWWVLCIFSGLLGLLACLYSMILVPMLVTYKYDEKWYKNFAICLKNSGIILCISPLQIFFVTVILAVPMIMCLFPQAKWWLVIILAIYGIVFYVLANIAYSQFYSDNYIYYLYNRGQEEVKKQQAKEAKTQQKAQQKAQQQNRPSYKKRKK